jgi:hypothetical protein
MRVRLPLYLMLSIELDIRDSGHYTVYAIEATVHAPTWEGVYGEILKVLKPGGVVSTGPRACMRTCMLIYSPVWCLRVVYDG